MVLEQTTRVGSAWRDGRWDSFTLVTPNWTVRLPGFPYRGDDPDGFMTRAEVVSHLEQYASSFGAPICCGRRVTAVDPSPDGKSYLVSTADGDAFTAPIVVVATGSFPFPGPSPFSGEGRAGPRRFGPGPWLGLASDRLANRHVTVLADQGETWPRSVMPGRGATSWADLCHDGSDSGGR